MKLGIISDIHAHFSALIAALDLLRDQGADRIVCAGDLIERGPDGERVVAFMRAEGIPTAQGNHDYMAIGNQAWLRENAEPDHPRVKEVLLSPDAIGFLQDLPKTVTLAAGSGRVLVAHGTPWNKSEYVFPHSPADVFRALAHYALKHEANVVILGHTHSPMRVQVQVQESDQAEARTVWIINPGSVIGPGYAGSHTCGLLSLPDMAFQVFDIARRRAVGFADETVSADSQV